MKVKQHHMCHILFIIHLVSLVLGKIICMQEKSQKCTNMKHRRQVDVAGDRGPTLPRQPTPPGIARRPPSPCHITYLWDGLLTASLALIHSGLIQRCMVCLGSMGPLSFTWRSQTDLQTASLAGKPTYLPCNRHLGAI
jgi:hypothetical protein